ncbi:MAG: hypothetical protein K0S45_271 [Nitrospira sp.]|nr:hypothetical protein [Nitrospira sp.]
MFTRRPSGMPLPVFKKLPGDLLSSAGLQRSSMDKIWIISNHSVNVAELPPVSHDPFPFLVLKPVLRQSCIFRRYRGVIQRQLTIFLVCIWS